MVIPRASVREAEFASAVAEVERMLHPQVLRIRYTLGNDWTGEPAVFFRIVLADASTTPDQLWNVTNRASTLLVQRVEPLEQWGVLPYFNFRSESEQAVLREEAWA